MSFSTEMAKLVADQISRFVTLNRHQLAGQVANLDFWLGEVLHAMEVLDGYGKRFQRLKTGQAKHVAEHHTIGFSLDDPCCTQGKPSPPQRVPDSELKDVRRTLTEATYRFLIRCFSDGLVTESAIRKACENLHIGVDTNDLKRRHHSTK
jgi:hypothetical protein